ncbi:MAG: CBS domain-containing protein [Thermoprotei archaeon]|nr:MAG: CBS domain-containing protein [Thermoprotei archaeon]
MKVWEVMEEAHIRMYPDDLVVYARSLFRKYGLRCIPIVNDLIENICLGFITRKEVLAATSRKSNIKVKDVMRDRPLLLPDMELAEAVKIMRQHNVHACPVVDTLQHKKLIGILTLRNIIRILRKAGYKPLAITVNEVMTRKDIPIAYPTDRVNIIWKRFLFEGENAIIITARKQSLIPIGIVTPFDFIKSGRWHFRRESETGTRSIARVKVVMTRGVMVAYPNSPIDFVADVIAENDFTLVPVVNESGKVIGYLTQFDVVRAYLEGRKPKRIRLPPVPIIIPEKPEEKIVYMTERARLLTVLLPRKAPVKPIGLLASNIMRAEIPAVEYKLNLEHARNYMLRSKSNYLLVLDENGRIKGYITSGNIITVIAEKGPLWKRRTYDKTFIEEVMGTDIPEVDPSTPIEEIAAIMYSRKCPIVIVGSRESPQGYITKDDVVYAAKDLLGKELTVENVIYPAGLGIAHPHHTLSHAIKRMQAYYLDALAVYDGAKIRGVLSENRLPFIALEDNVKGVKSRRLLWVRRLVKGGRKLARYIKITPLLVEDAMVRVFETVKLTDTLDVVIELFKKYNIDGIPVVDEEGRIIGIICKNDILRELARRVKVAMKKIEEEEAKIHV